MVSKKVINVKVVEDAIGTERGGNDTQWYNKFRAAKYTQFHRTGLGPAQ